MLRRQKTLAGADVDQETSHGYSPSPSDCVWSR